MNKPIPKKNDRPAPPLKTRCDEIQPLLFDYLSHELSPSRADLVRQHLEQCATCRETARDLKATADILKAKADVPSPPRLSERHRHRLMRAITHPLLNWMDRHRVLTTLAVLLILALVLACLLRVREYPKTEDTPSVTVSLRLDTTETNAPGPGDTNRIAPPAELRPESPPQSGPGKEP